MIALSLLWGCAAPEALPDPLATDIAVSATDTLAWTTGGRLLHGSTEGLYLYGPQTDAIEAIVEETDARATQLHLDSNTLLYAIAHADADDMALWSVPLDDIGAAQILRTDLRNTERQVIVLSPDGDRVAFVSSDTDKLLLHGITADTLTAFEPAFPMLFSPDSDLLLVRGAAENSQALIDLGSFEIIETPFGANATAIKGMRWDDNGLRLIISVDETNEEPPRNVLVADLVNSQQRVSLMELTDTYLTGFAWSPSGGRIAIWSQECISEDAVPEEGIPCSSPINTLYSVSLFRRRNVALIQTSLAPSRLAFNPDGTQLALTVGSALYVFEVPE